MVESVGGVRHSILDMAPLELDCMNALWPLGEATVRAVHLALAPSRPCAYTTIMTILDRLAQKKVVTRRKVGRAWVYRPNLSVDEARSHAVAQIVDGFFDGSAEALAAHLSATGDLAPGGSSNSGALRRVRRVESSTPGGDGDASA
jgi:BlaI family transcriptional regulator, penicillinase repressor